VRPRLVTGVCVHRINSDSKERALVFRGLYAVWSKQGYDQQGNAMQWRRGISRVIVRSRKRIKSLVSEF
jgi:hypothetical protein